MGSQCWRTFSHHRNSIISSIKFIVQNDKKYLDTYLYLQSYSDTETLYRCNVIMFKGSKNLDPFSLFDLATIVDMRAVSTFRGNATSNNNTLSLRDIIYNSFAFFIEFTAKWSLRWPASFLDSRLWLDLVHDSGLYGILQTLAHCLYFSTNAYWCITDQWN